MKRIAVLAACLSSSFSFAFTRDLLPQRPFAVPPMSKSTRLFSSRGDNNNNNNQHETTTTTAYSPSPSSSSTTIHPKSSSRWTVSTVAVTSLLATSLAAKAGLLGVSSGGGGDYSLPGVVGTTAILQDVGASLLTGSLGYIFVKLVTYAAADRSWLDPRDSRKLIHTFSAPLFILFWPLYTANAGARVFAALVPMVNALRLYLAATSDDGEETSLARAVSRSGAKSEALGGPFVYVVILAASILTFWRDSPIGIVALSTLAAGDGVADLVGRRWGKGNAWPGLNKSVAGSLGFVIASTLCSMGLLLWMQYCQCLSLPYAGLDLWIRVTVISVVAAILELIPIADDNYTVPLSAALMTMLLLQ